MSFLFHGQISKSCMVYINEILLAVALVINFFPLIHSQGSHIYTYMYMYMYVFMCVCARTWVCMNTHACACVSMICHFISLSCVLFCGYRILFIHLAWEILHYSCFVFMDIYNRHYSWTFKLFPYWCCCEQCFHEHWSVDVYFHFCEYITANRMARLHHNCTISMASNHQLFSRAALLLCINTSDWVLQNFQIVFIAYYCVFLTLAAEMAMRTFLHMSSFHLYMRIR